MRCAGPATSSRRAASRSRGTDRWQWWGRRLHRALPIAKPEPTPSGFSSAARNGAPALKQWPRHAVDRVADRRRNRGNLRHCAVVTRRAGRAHIRALAARIGTDDYQIRARSLALVSNAGRDYDDVARAQLNRLATRAAEPDAHRPGGDAEHFVRSAVIMMVRIDTVAPSAAPTVALEQRHTGLGGLGAGL